MGFLNELWNYLITTAPILLLGLGVAGLIHGFITVERIKKVLGGNTIGSIFKAAIMGIPLPLCSCGVIPAAVTLRKSGASNGATSSFLIATPESGIDSIAMTYAMMDLPMTIIRPVAAFFSAFIAGILQFFFNDFEIKKDEELKSACCSKTNKEEVKKENPFLKGTKFAFHDLINDISLWLAFGIVLGAVIGFAVPEELIENLNGWGGRLILLAVGIPLYICASATTPIAASLMMKGLSPGLALIILLTGPATNLANILVLQKYIGKKGIFINILAIAVVTLIFSFLVDYLYAAYSWPLVFNISSHEHGHGAAWWETASAVILVIMLVKGILQKEIFPRFKKEKAGCH
jgi:uncharacterized membrane protein YraQ (UPF0718 family)